MQAGDLFALIRKSIHYQITGKNIFLGNEDNNGGWKHRLFFSLFILLSARSSCIHIHNHVRKVPVDGIMHQTLAC